MAVNRSQRFIYFQNKAKHYSNIKTIKAAVDHGPPAATIAKKHRPMPLLLQQSIKIQNQHLIDRIVNIAKSKKAQIETEGTYSRCYKINRPFRQHNKYKEETERAITIDNRDFVSRLSNIKPAIGISSEWKKHYNRLSDCRKNLSKFFETNRSKAQLHISTERFVPQHLRDYGFNRNSESNVVGKQVTVPFQKLFQLPKLPKKQRYNFNLEEFARTKDDKEERI